MLNVVKNNFNRLYNLFKRNHRTCENCRHKITRVEKKIIEQYLAREKIKKLHLGCGNNIIEGWLNSDASPKSKDIVRIDATRTYPFDNETFDYIFAEHVIEHLTYLQGRYMLNECFRVLKNGGKIRITTPNLFFLVSLYQSEKTDMQKKYIKWATERYIDGAPYFEDTFVINNFVRHWGHKFIYDEKVLRFSFEKAGFKEIARCDLNESQDEVLKNLENERRLPEGFLRLESFTLEGTKLVNAIF